MRDLAMVLLVAGVLPFAIRHTWIAVMLWTWVSIMNPHKLAWSFATNLPFAAVAAGAAFISLLVSRDKLRFPWDKSVIALLLFIAWTMLTTAFAFFPQQSLVELNRIVKIQVMTLVALAAIRERKHIELFVWINALSIAFYGFKGGIFTIASGGSQRVWGPDGGFIEGNNEIGLALIIVIPLLNYLRMISSRRSVRWFLLLTMVLSAIAALGTQSRGAFLAIAAMATVLWLRSGHKLASGTFIVVLAAFALTFMPASWTERMRSIESYEMDSSAMGRLHAWQTMINIANDRPTGGGFAVYEDRVFAHYGPVENVRAAHSIYFQVLGEHGWIGLALFLAIGFYAFVATARVRKQAREHAETLWLYHLAGMVQVAMVGYAVGGSFLSLAYFDLPYNLLVVVVALRYWLLEKRWLVEPTGAFGSTVPVQQTKHATARAG
jgi:putative inorganic carbon (HCO3(-)) transporter